MIYVVCNALESILGLLHTPGNLELLQLSNFIAEGCKDLELFLEPLLRVADIILVVLHSFHLELHLRLLAGTARNAAVLLCVRVLGTQLRPRCKVEAIECFLAATLATNIN